MSYSFSIGASYGYGYGYGSYSGYYPYSRSDYLQSMRAVIEAEALSGSSYGYPSSYGSSYGFGFDYGYGSSDYYPASSSFYPSWDFPVATSVYCNPFDSYYLPRSSYSFYSYSSFPGSYYSSYIAV